MVTDTPVATLLGQVRPLREVRTAVHGSVEGRRRLGRPQARPRRLPPGGEPSGLGPERPRATPWPRRAPTRHNHIVARPTETGRHSAGGQQVNTGRPHRSNTVLETATPLPKWRGAVCLLPIGRPTNHALGGATARGPTTAENNSLGHEPSVFTAVLGR